MSSGRSAFLGCVAVALWLLSAGTAAATQTVVVTNGGGSSAAAYTGSPTGGLTPVAGSPFTTGQDPHGVAFTPDGRFAYVANQGDDDISRFSVADDAQLTPLGTTPTGANQPAGLTVSADGSLLMASNRDGTDTAPRVSVFNIDAATGGLTAVTGSPFNVGIFDPRGIVMTADRRFAYVSGRRGPTGPPATNAQSALAVLSIGANGALTPIVGSPFYNAALLAGFGMSISPDGGRLFMAQANDQKISVYNLNQSNGAPSFVAPFSTVNQSPIEVEPTTDGLRLYASEVFGKSVEGFSINQGTGALTTIPGTPEDLGQQAQSLKITPDGNTLFVSRLFDPGSVSSLSIAANGDLSLNGAPTATGGPFPSNFGVGIAPTQTPDVAFDHSAVTPGQPTTFTSTSTVRGGYATRFDWDFGDGTTLADGGPDATHTFADTKPYTVTLTVANDCDPAAIYTGEVVWIGSRVVCNGPRTATGSVTVDAGVVLKAKAKSKQPAGKVVVKLTCPEGDCTVELSGKTKGKGKSFKLKRKSVDVPAAQKTKVKLKYAKGKKAVRKLKDLARSSEVGDRPAGRSSRRGRGKPRPDEFSGRSDRRRDTWERESIGRHCPPLYTMKRQNPLIYAGSDTPVSKEPRSPTVGTCSTRAGQRDSAGGAEQLQRTRASTS